MKSKIIFISSLPAILFFLGIIFFAYSPLTTSKIISVQNEVFSIFFQALSDTDLLSALITTFEYFFINVLWIVLLFLVLISCGFLVYLYYIKKVDIRAIIVSQILMIILVLILTNFSITMFLTSISLFIGTMWMHKTFEPGEKIFSTGYSVIVSRIGMMSVFLVLGVLITLIVNMESYEEAMMQTNMDLIKNFMPDMTGAKEAQKNQIEQITEGFKYALSERYDILPEETKNECSVLYEGLTESLDSYKDQTFQKIDEQELAVSEEDIVEIFPLLGLIVKATPLIIAISAYALLSILTPVMGIFGGMVYSAVKKK
jgi:hypothetical protein